MGSPGQKLECGFNAGCDNEYSDENVLPEILAITKIMSEKLDKHFIFGFTDVVVVAPMLYGGYSSDDSIVGVLTSRVWT